MQKPLVNNRRLNEKWSAQTNELMIKKLQGVKPQINMKCPESFFFYKTQFKKGGKPPANRFEQFEITKNNENLLRKLLDVNIERQTKLGKNRAPVFTFKKNFLTGNKKYDIIKIAQENQSMLKRLNERSSCYNVGKWEKDYQMNQYYKRNHCMFPSIDFKRSNSGLFIMNNTTMNKNLGSMSAERRPYNNSYSNFAQLENYPYLNENVDIYCQERGNYIQMNNDDNINSLPSGKDFPKVLYKTQVFLGTLGSSRIEFAVQTQNFTIRIESVYEKDKVYAILFDSRKSVENIQKYYKKYEEMIAELEYDELNDVVKFNNLIKKDLICKCVKLPPKEDTYYNNPNKRHSSGEGDVEGEEREEQKELSAEITKKNSEGNEHKSLNKSAKENTEKNSPQDVSLPNEEVNPNEVQEQKNDYKDVSNHHSVEEDEMKQQDQEVIVQKDEEPKINEEVEDKPVNNQQEENQTPQEEIVESIK